MNEQPVIGLDLGGTNIKARLVDRSGTILTAVNLPSEIEQGPDHVIARMAEAAEQVCTQHGVSLKHTDGIGVGSPGPLDVATGVVIRSVNLPGWVNIPLRRRLQDATGRPATLINDASAACFGEFWAGGGKGVSDIVLFTLGTGLGGGVVSGGSLLLGHFDQAGELGHIIVHPGGRPCGCGQRGCLEAYASESHLTQRAIEEGVFAGDRGGGVPALLGAVRRGDTAAVRIWQECCEALATACVTLQHILNPKLVLLGGGVSAAGDELIEPVREAFTRMTWKMADDAPSIELAALGNDAGAIGAAGWFIEQTGKRVSG